ncbi:MAG: hypothetical protein ACI8PZ_003371 [Myxococcota bacterium]
MDVNTSVLLGVVGVIAANQVVARLPWATRTAWVFWPVVLIDLIVGVAVIIGGLPGFEHVRAVSLVVGLMLLFHVAHNLRTRSEITREDALEARRQVTSERARQLADALEKGESSS